MISTTDYPKNLFSVFIYKEGRKEGRKEGKDANGKKKILWKNDGEIRAPPSLQPPLTNPRGVAIHSPLNYCVICDNDYRRILFNITWN